MSNDITFTSNDTERLVSQIASGFFFRNNPTLDVYVNASNGVSVSIYASQSFWRESCVHIHGESQLAHELASGLVKKGIPVKILISRFDYAMMYLLSLMDIFF